MIINKTEATNKSFNVPGFRFLLKNIAVNMV